MQKFLIEHKKAVIAVCTLSAALFVFSIGWIISQGRTLTSFETALLQIIQIFVAVVSSYFFARVTNSEQVSRAIGERAGLAFKRVLRLINAYSILSATIERKRVFLRNETDTRGYVKGSVVESALDDLADIIAGHYGTVSDIATDWAEIGPPELMDKLKGGNK